MTWWSCSETDRDKPGCSPQTQDSFPDPPQLYALSSSGRYLAVIETTSFLHRITHTDGRYPDEEHDVPDTCNGKFLLKNDINFEEYFVFRCAYRNNFCAVDSVGADGYVTRDTRNRHDDPRYTSDDIVRSHYVWCSRVAILYERGEC